MEHPYIKLGFKCAGYSWVTASAIAGSISLLGETTTGAFLYANTTRRLGMETMNLITQQAVFIGFFSVLIAGVIWSVIFAFHKYRTKQPPVIFGSNADQRLAALEQGMSVIKQDIALLKQKAEEKNDADKK